MKIKILILAMILIGLFSITVHASPIGEISWTKFDGDEMSASSTNSIQSIERDQTVEVKVKVHAFMNVRDSQVTAYLSGYDSDELVQDVSETFDLSKNYTHTSVLKLTLPVKLEKDRYKLRVRWDDRSGETASETYDLNIESTNHAVWIRDVIFNPENEVIAGRALLTSVRVKNVGMDTEDGIKIKVSIPDLGISANDYIDSLDADQSTTSEQLFMRIPLCAKKGTYEVDIDVEYKDGDKDTTTKKSINVIEDEACAQTGTQTTIPNNNQPANFVNFGITSQDVQIGAAGATYPITITNNAAASRSYSITVDAGNWAVTRISPGSVVLLQSGQSATVYVYVAASQSAQIGQQMFLVTVKSGNDLVQQVPMKANVIAGEAQSNDMSGILELILIVLVVLLVILGVVIAVKKLKESKEQEENTDEDLKPYY